MRGIPGEPGQAQAVVFDLFGTLIDNFRRDEFHAIVAEAARLMDAPPEPFAAEIRKLIPGSLTGGYDIAGEAALACQALGLQRTLEQATAAAAAWRVWALGLLQRPRNGVIVTLQTLRERGIGTGLISDCAEDIPVLWPQSPLAALIDVPVFSAREGIAKPDVDIYLRACRRLGVEPSAALYVGDTADEVVGALAAGLQALRIQAPHESAETHAADRSTWEGPTIGSIPDLLPWLAMNH